MKKTLNFLLIFGLGASCYCLLETLWRGYTHWTMGLTGGACLTTLYQLAKRTKDWSLAAKAAVGSGIITAYEFTVGCLVNLKLGWNVWDYSGLPLNLAGQICLLFSFLWFLLCFPVFGLCKFLRKNME